ncbi:MAG: DUF366 family protein [Deltaproteobacteria bacterium]|nr:DUF366 family protein [Deltaproteobacteria bacterium]
MKTKLIDQTIKYDGSQLRPHFIYEQTGLLGDAAVAFIGPCEVKLDKMVDLEDVRDQAPIYSPKMLHFLVETFPANLLAAVHLQRLTISMIKDNLAKEKINLMRSGDDLYQKEKKLSVSIATVSTLSSLIHIGLNIETKNTPVATVGLSNFKVEPKAFAKKLLAHLAEEYQSILKATYKVKSV